MASPGTRKHTMSIDGDEHHHEILAYKLTPSEADSDGVTFAEANGEGDGGKDWTLTITALQDPGDADSLFNKIWDFSGTDVPYILRPYGNAVASPTQPHFKGILTIDLPDGDFLAAEANKDPKGRPTFEVTFKCAGKPERVTTGA